MMLHLALALGSTLIYLVVLAIAVLIGRSVARRTNKFWLGVLVWAIVFYGISTALVFNGLPLPGASAGPDA